MREAFCDMGREGQIDQCRASFDKPRYGRFIDTGEWMIFQGGRMSWKEYYYRIGNNRIGRNQVMLEPFGRRNFFELFAGERLIVRIQKCP